MLTSWKMCQRHQNCVNFMKNMQNSWKTNPSNLPQAPILSPSLIVYKYYTSNPPAPACQGPPGCEASSMSFFHYFCFICSFCILLNLLSHTFPLSHIAIDLQSGNPISQRLFTPLPPRAQKQVSNAWSVQVPLAFKSPGPPNPCGKTHVPGFHLQSAW
jgi:hypothetical protein